MYLPWNASKARLREAEHARKDVYRFRPGGSVTIKMPFRQFAWTIVAQCHNTQHEEHSMLLRWDLNRGLVPLPTPIPTPDGVTFISSNSLPGA